MTKSGQQRHECDVHGFKTPTDADFVSSDPTRLSEWRKLNGYTDQAGQCRYCEVIIAKRQFRRHVQACRISHEVHEDSGDEIISESSLDESAESNAAAANDDVIVISSPEHEADEPLNLTIHQPVTSAQSDQSTGLSAPPALFNTSSASQMENDDGEEASEIELDNCKRKCIQLGDENAVLKEENVRLNKENAELLRKLHEVQSEMIILLKKWFLFDHEFAAVNKI